MSDFIFQCVPERYRLSDLESPPDTPECWQATRYRREMRPKDGVYFYMSGPAAGIYGCGRIIAPPDEQTMSVRVKWTHLYPSRIARNELQALLGNNLLFTVRVGTNFLLSPAESTALRNLLRGKGLRVA